MIAARCTLAALALLAAACCGTAYAVPASPFLDDGQPQTTGSGVTITSTSQTTATTLPIGTWAGQSYRTMARVIVPAAAGDLLDVDARARATNDAPNPRYTVGIGSGLWMYDVDDGLGSAGPWTLIDSQTGDNVTVDRHHIPISITGVYTVPADWPVGHRMVIVLRCDAASTAARAGDAVTVDHLTRLTVRNWGPPPE